MYASCHALVFFAHAQTNPEIPKFLHEISPRFAYQHALGIHSLTFARLLAAQRSLNLHPDSVHSLVGVDFPHDTVGSVVIQDGDGLAVVARQSLHKGRGGIVGTLHEGLTGLVILHRLRHGLAVGTKLHALGRGKLDMVRSSGLLVNPSAADALLEDLVGYLQLNDLGNGGTLLGEHLVEGLGLDEGAGETVEDETEAAVGILDAVADDADDDIIGHEAASLHDGGGLETNLGLGGDGGTEHVAGGELGDGKEILNLGTVSAFSGARWTEQDHNVARPVGGELILGLLHGLLHLLALAEAESGGSFLIEMVREGESLSGLSVKSVIGRA